MDRDDYAEVVPDPQRRCALSGMLGRELWGIASEGIWAALQAHIEDLELDITPLEPKTYKDGQLDILEGAQAWLDKEFDDDPGRTYTANEFQVMLDDHFEQLAKEADDE